MGVAHVGFRLSAKEIALAWYRKFGYVAETRWVYMHSKFKIDVYYTIKGVASDCFSINLSASGGSENTAWEMAVMNICKTTMTSMAKLAEEAELMAVSNDLNG